MVLWCVVRPDFRSTRQLPTPSMSTSAQLRLLRDWKEIRSSPPEGCSASPHDESNLFIWGATVFGPDETPWEGGVFSLRLTFTDQYPDRPPRVRFVSDVFHPNGASWLPCAEVLRSHCFFSLPGRNALHGHARRPVVTHQQRVHAVDLYTVAVDRPQPGVTCEPRGCPGLPQRPARFQQAGAALRCEERRVTRGWADVGTWAGASFHDAGAAPLSLRRRLTLSARSPREAIRLTSKVNYSRVVHLLGTFDHLHVLGIC